VQGSLPLTPSRATARPTVEKVATASRMDSIINTLPYHSQSSEVDDFSAFYTNIFRIEESVNTVRQNKLRIAAKTPQNMSINKIISRSAAVAVIADRTAYGVRYSCKPLSGIAVVSMSIYLFTILN